MPWGRGDIYTLIIGAIIFALACIFHRAAIGRAGHNAGTIIIELMGNALSFGPLLMILADPFSKGYLLGLVIAGSRITLWYAAFIACINGGVAILRQRDI